MKTMKSAAMLAGLLAALGVPPVVADDAPAKVEGEVIQVVQRTENAGDLDTLRIRTRQGEEMRLVLGAAGSTAGSVQAGDRIRARLSNGGPTEQGYCVQSMKVRRTGQTLRYRNASGDVLQTQVRSRDRDRDRDGTGSGTAAQDRTRARIHEPGTGGCSGGDRGASRGNGGTGRGRR